jgi:hypothetical protein
MNWNTLVKVARYHMFGGWILYLAAPWFVLVVNFALYLAGAAAAKPPPPGQFYGSGAVFAIYICFAIPGVVGMLRSLPFALSLGVSRRAYYAGTALLGVGLAAVYGLALAVLAVIERATTGWGVRLDFFQVSYILAGPWYLTWLTSFVGLAVLFVYGMWWGLVYWRWDVAGLLVFGAAQILVGGAGALAATKAGAWPAIGRFFTTLGAAGLTGVLAALAVVLLASGYATMRRVTV